MSGARQKYSQTEIDQLLVTLNTNLPNSETRWQLANGKLSRKFVFADFVAAVGFMAQVALVAERMNHHPEWYNVYATVDVQITTHDAQGITRLDAELAQVMNQVAERLLT